MSENWKVGDRIRIPKWWARCNAGCDWWNGDGDMDQYLGKSATITLVRGSASGSEFLELNIDGGEWNWHRDFLIREKNVGVLNLVEKMR